MNKKKIGIIVVALAVAAVFVVYFFVLKPQMDAGKEEAAAVETMPEYYYFVPGDYFVTNVKDSLSLIKLNTALALTGKDQTEFLTTNMAMIRNQIIKVVMGHTEEELRNPEAIGMLESEMTTAVKEALKMEDLQAVIISDYVIQ